MNTPYKYLNRLAVISLCLLGLNACTPSFKTTAEECVTFSPVSLAYPVSSDDTDFKVATDSPINDYKLYLEDALNSFNNAQSTTGTTFDTEGNLERTDPKSLSADEDTAIQFLLNKAFETMGYVIENGEVAYAANPLDFLEYLIAASDEDEVIETFVDAKINVAQAAAKENSNCNYRNDLINLLIEDPANNNEIIKTVNANLSINYDPFLEGIENTIDQVIALSFDEPLTDLNLDDRLEQSFAGVSKIYRDEFNQVGASPLSERALSINTNESNQVFMFEEEFKSEKIGIFTIEQFNIVCYLRDEEGNIIRENGKSIQTTCEDLTDIREPQHISCKGGTDSDGKELEDETNQVQKSNFTIVAGNNLLTNIQRFRVEIDYKLNELRFYASKYKDAILRADVADPENPVPETEVIFNPTTCEKNAIAQDIRNKLPEDERDTTIIFSTPVIDPYYDITYLEDEEGNQVIDENNELIIDKEPIPVFTFQGTAIPERQ